MVGLDSIIAVVAVIVAILVAVFVENNHKYIDTKKANMFPKLKAAIDTEIGNYQKEEEAKKRPVLNKVLALDSFRIALRAERQTLNTGLLWFGASVVYFIFLIYVAPYASLGSFFTNTPNILAAGFALIAEFLMLPLIGAYRRFNELWRINTVFSEHFENENQDLTNIVCKYFQPNYTKSKFGKV